LESNDSNILTNRGDLIKSNSPSKTEFAKKEMPNKINIDIIHNTENLKENSFSKRNQSSKMSNITV
jgi:hypothetical protein